MPKFPGKNTQGDDASKLEMKKVKEESKPWDEYFVPKEHLSVKVSQHVWSQLGIFSRQRLLKEHPTNVGEACFSCQKEQAVANPASHMHILHPMVFNPF